ncbi:MULTISPECIES: SGNH/GDSL hydrolase family protein [unclassified Chamaesiphon]|uniref:SGNH/GDSL hydrolase family protein n=1 Tax=unclassified Chamaesiphon TaxID=2620921 RepID=UPI00286C59FC|nr:MULTISPECIES: SGNH/GDSL hydrolase family protein [unclassified Chamaesiphon]
MSKFFLLWIALGLGLLGSSIFINFLLYNRAKQYYFELNQTRLDPVGLSYYAQNLQQVTNSTKSRIVFFGDSRAASWTSPQLDGYEFINRGIPSQTSIQTIERFSAHVRLLKPKIVVIQVGVNDLKTIALFPERKQEIIANCQANINRIVSETKSLGAVAIVTTIFPVGEVPLERKSFWSDDIAVAIKEVNTYIATLADDKTIVFDTFPLLADARGMMLDKYRLDELHLNPQGYALLDRELVKRIGRLDRSGKNKK